MPALLLLLGCPAPDEPSSPEDSDTTGSEPTADTGTPLTGDTDDTDIAPIEDTAWEAFVDGRDDLLVDLGVPILGCPSQPDTSHPAFHGCIDWHSAVHANWALHTLYRLTGDLQYLDAAEEVLGPVRLQGELDDLEAGQLSFEIPYGYSWFLLLAREREASTGETDLVPLAEVVERDLAAWADDLTLPEARGLVLEDEYGNFSWAVLNLWQQAAWNGDLVAQAHWEDVVRTVLLPMDAECPLEEDRDNSGFFPSCLHRPLAIVTVLPEAESADWAAAFLPVPVPAIAPRTTFPLAHMAGLNWSRTWGLWALWSATDDPAWRDLYLDHVLTHADMPEYWAQDYWSYAHWIPQFGVYGVALSYE